MTKGRQCIRILLLLLLLVGSATDTLRAQAGDEYKVKAVFIYNFTTFVKWPDSAFDGESAPIVIGVLGKNPFGKSLEHAVSGELINGRPIIIRYLDKPKESAQCHIIFISKAFSGSLAEVWKHIEGKPILRISDRESFMEHSGMLRMYTDQNKIRLEINLEKTNEAQLHVSSKLLSLAKIYNDKR